MGDCSLLIAAVIVSRQLLTLNLIYYLPLFISSLSCSCGDTKSSLLSPQSRQFLDGSIVYNRRLLTISSPRWHPQVFQGAQAAAYSIIAEKKKKDSSIESIPEVDDSFFTPNSQKPKNYRMVKVTPDESQVENRRVHRKEMRELRNRFFWRHWVMKHPNYIWTRARRKGKQKPTDIKDGLHTKEEAENIIKYSGTEAERRQVRINLWNTWVMNHPAFKHSKFGQLKSAGKVRGHGRASLMRNRAQKMGRYFRSLRVGQENNTFLRFHKIPVKDRLMKRLVRKIDFGSAQMGQAYFRRLRVGQAHNDFLKYRKVELSKPQPGQTYLRSLRLGGKSNKFDKFRKILFDADGDLKARRKKERRSSKDLKEDHWKVMTKKIPEHLAAEEREEKLARGIPDHWTIEQWEYITKFPNHRTAEEWKRMRNFSSNLGHKRAVAKTVELETYQISDLVLELDAHDNPFVRPFNADDAAEQRRQWPHLGPDEEEIVRRSISVAETVAECKAKWKAQLRPFDHRRITERDVLSVAFLGPDTSSTTGPHIYEPPLGSLTSFDLQEIGVPDFYSTEPRRVTSLLLHRIERAQYPLHQEVNYSPFSLTEALGRTSSFHQLRRIITPLLHLPEGCYLISQCNEAILAACARDTHNVDDESYISTVFVFLRTIANRLAMFAADDGELPSFHIPAAFWPTKYADLFFVEFSEELKEAAELLELDESVVDQLEKEVEVEMKEEKDEEEKAFSGKNRD
ncbi:hypothetical protein B0T20DRAFT_361509 [Sordaria brevicollis]|uniref:Uncharacterized protein n=1 Tax=Sordaria brevicollis TaxID=83679 RepID=A0AAE0P1Z5_SORBR|nr:hypothetical protein B0T20DRAFT_361509 [Sordaria brevicollis]